MVRPHWLSCCSSRTTSCWLLILSEDPRSDTPHKLFTRSGLPHYKHDKYTSIAALIWVDLPLTFSTFCSLAISCLPFWAGVRPRPPALAPSVQAIKINPSTLVQPHSVTATVSTKCCSTILDSTNFPPLGSISFSGFLQAIALLQYLSRCPAFSCRSFAFWPLLVSFLSFCHVFASLLFFSCHSPLRVIPGPFP